MVGLGSSDALLGALERGRSIRFSAYLLRPGRILEALEAAAERGAEVHVTLEGAPFGGAGVRPARVAELNACTAAELRRHGARVHLASDDEPVAHLKAAVVDGTAFLDDRNWPSLGRDTIVETSEPGDVDAVASALRGVPRSSGQLATEKDLALALESDLIERASAGEIACESESFTQSTVYGALKARAMAGAHVRLLVSRRDLHDSRDEFEARALRLLAQAGVEIRVCESGEKLCVAGDDGWVGSANASGGAPRSLDWGLRTRDPALVDALRGRFEWNWERGTAYAS